MIDKTQVFDRPNTPSVEGPAHVHFIPVLATLNSGASGPKRGRKNMKMIRLTQGGEFQTPFFRHV